MPKEIDRHEHQSLVAAGTQLVDVMPKAEFEESHIADRPAPWVVVTTLSGQLVGVARPEQIHAAAGGGGG